MLTYHVKIFIQVYTGCCMLQSFPWIIISSSRLQIEFSQITMQLGCLIRKFLRMGLADFQSHIILYNSVIESLLFKALIAYLSQLYT